jgi:hypothetical protein
VLSVVQLQVNPKPLLVQARVGQGDDECSPSLADAIQGPARMRPWPHGYSTTVGRASPGRRRNTVARARPEACRQRLERPSVARQVAVRDVPPSGSALPCGLLEDRERRRMVLRDRQRLQIRDEQRNIFQRRLLVLLEPEAEPVGRKAA